MNTRPIRHQVLAALTLMLCGIGAAQAQAHSVQAQRAQRIDNRQAHQEERIDRGIQNGSLTRPEARRLERQQRGIERAESRAQADGHVSRHEARQIEARQDRASAHIRHAKHDRQHRHPH